MTGSRRSNPFSSGAGRRDGLLRHALAMTRRHFGFNFKQQIHVRLLAARIARGLPIVSPSTREQGMPDARCTRGLVCKVMRKKRTRAYRFSGEHPTFPAQWLDGLWRAHPGEFMAFVASVASRKPARRPGWACSASARLDAYRFQASGPHAFAVRFGTARQHVPEPLTEFTRPAGPIPRTMPPRPPQLLPQRSVTMANAPSIGDRMA